MFVRSFARSCVRACGRSFVCLFMRSFVRSLVLLFVRSLAYSSFCFLFIHVYCCFCTGFLCLVLTLSGDCYCCCGGGGGGGGGSDLSVVSKFQ